MTSLALGLIHTCILISKTQDQKLLFDQGNAEIIEGSVLTGNTSGAYGSVKSVVIDSGSWEGDDAAGYLTLSNVSGEFSDDEIIRTNTSGTASADGTNIPHHLEYGVPSYTESTTSTSCRFITSSGKNTTEKNDRGEHLIDEPVLILPNTLSPKAGDTVEAFSETYTINGVEPIYNLFNNSIHHYECELRRVD